MIKLNDSRNVNVLGDEQLTQVVGGHRGGHRRNYGGCNDYGRRYDCNEYGRSYEGKDDCDDRYNDDDSCYGYGRNRRYS